MIDGQATNDFTGHALPPSLVHDLRTPLNQIIGYSEMLAEQARDAGQPAFVPDLDKVRAAGLRMLSILEGHVAEPSGVQAEPEVSLTLHTEAADSEAHGLLLVVDDDEGNRDVLSRRLEQQGYTVANAENGRRALEMLGANAYDMVLLDIVMPELDGYEVLRQIKADESLRHIPVVMISGLSEMDSVARCIEMGADDYLPKPFNPTLLKARVGASLDKKRGRDREVLLFEELQTNYKRLQDLEQLRDDLTNMIVHDLRTPLTSVTAAMQTIDQVGEVNEAQREIMTIAVEGADSLLAMINSLLDVEKLESGAMELDVALVSLPELISAALSQVAPLAKAKDVELIEQINPDLPWLPCDENKLQRTLVNLVGNAIKFTPPGGTITVEVTSGEQPPSVKFCVSDTGEGIPQEAFDRIFEKFGQVKSREGGRQMSTGLGLTFCKLAVEAHGGQIGVESVPGHGSMFSFWIPRQSPAEIDAAPAAL
jgi:two-component system, sensor histidine kinase and response regulator